MPPRGLKPGRYAVHPSGKLYPARRARWFKPVAFVTLRRRDIEAGRSQEKKLTPLPPALTQAKISLKGAPSAMEQLAESWKRRA